VHQKNNKWIEHAIIYMNAKFEFEQKLMQILNLNKNYATGKQREISTIVAVATIHVLSATCSFLFFPLLTQALFNSSLYVDR
jgi:hypothetical protein